MEQLLREIVNDLKVINKRYFIIILILIASFVGSNAYWIWNSMQWEYITTTTETNGGDANILTNTGEGDIRNGEGNSENKD